MSFHAARRARRAGRISARPRRPLTEPLERRTLLSFAAFISAHYGGLPV